MSIALRTQQKLVFIILALVTILALGFILVSTVAHIDVWHMLLSWGPRIMYGGN